MLSCIALCLSLLVANTVTVDATGEQEKHVSDMGETCLVQTIKTFRAHTHTPGLATHQLAEPQAHHLIALQRQARKCINRYADGLDAVQPSLGDSIRSHPLRMPTTSTRELILGGGSGSTATRSLACALSEQLGLCTLHRSTELCHGTIRANVDRPDHIIGRLGSILNSTSGVSDCITSLRNFNYPDFLQPDIEAWLDAPTAELFLDVFLSFPKAKVILTVRPAGDWVNARKSFAYGAILPPMQEPCGRSGQVADATFTDLELAALFNLQNELVECVTPPEQLFTIDVFSNSTDGLMTRLAEFLGLRAPPPGSPGARYPSGKVAMTPETAQTSHPFCSED